MPNLKIWSEKELSRLKQDMDRLFEGFYLELGLPASTGQSGIELIDAGDVLQVRVLVPPGIPAGDMELTVFEDGLRLYVVRRADYRGGRAHGGLSRTVSLPCRVDPDKARARIDEGVLTIELPKCAQPRRKIVRIEES